MQHTHNNIIARVVEIPPIALIVIGALALGGCTVVSVASSVVGATVSVGSAAVSVASTVVSGTVKAGGAVVDAVTPDSAPK